MIPTSNNPEDIIKYCLVNKLIYLDLSQCGIDDYWIEQHKEIFNNLETVEEINLGNYLWIEGQKQKSKIGIKNQLSKFDIGLLPTSIQTIHLCDLGLTEIKNSAHPSKNLTRIELSDNKLEEVDLSGCEKLTFLGLSNNNISKLEEKLKLPSSLKQLFLMQNPIGSINSDYFNSFQLTLLDLSGTNINTINFIQNHSSLEKLFLYNTSQLTDVNAFDKVIFTLKNLRILDLDNNIELNKYNTKNALKYRSTLFNQLCGKKEDFIRYLKDVSCQFTDKMLAEAFERTKQTDFSYPSFLIYNHVWSNFKGCLDLGNCNLTSEKTDISDETKLNSSDANVPIIAKNSTIIFELLDVFGEHIRELNLGSEYINFGSKGELIQSANENQPNRFDTDTLLNFAELKKLQRINIRKCNLIKFPKFCEETIQIIDLSNNQLQSEEIVFDKFKSLKKLYLSGNNLTTFIAKFNPDFAELVLDQNKIEKIELKGSKQIENLGLSNNEITSIGHINLSSNLIVQNISLQSNKIETIGDEIFKLSNKVQFINLLNNPIKDCPDYVLQTIDLKQITNYFEQFKNKEGGSHQEDRIFKLVIIGDIGVGKTTISDFLINEGKKSENDQKNYIYNDWKISKKLTIKVFDFNNTIYENELYKLWMDNDTTYLVVWKNDLLNNQNSDRIEFWLDTIANISYDLNKTTTFLVQSHVENYPIDRLYIDKNLLTAYRINDVFYVNKENLFKIKSKLVTYFKEKSEKQETNSKQFYDIRNKILSRIKKSVKDWVILENETQEQNFAKFLHNIGYIYFDETENKIYKSNYVYNELTKFIQNKINNGNGEFQIDEKEQENLGYKILKNHQFFFPNPLKQNYYFSPKYLPSTDVIEDIIELFENDLNEDSLLLRFPNFYYSKIMESVLNYLMKSDTTTLKHFWRHGLFALSLVGDQKNGSKIFIRGFQESAGNKSTIRITVQKSENQSQIFKELTTMINQLAFRNNFQKENSSDFLFIDRLEYANGIDSLFHPIKSIKLGLESNNTLFAAYSKFFNYSTSMTMAKNVFISYSHNNASYMMKLRTHLASLRYSNLIKDWVDSEIRPGDKWEETIIANLSKVDIFIILLSADLIASRYSMDIELKKALDLNKFRNVRIIPIYIQPFDIEGFPMVSGQNLLDFEILPKRGEKLLPVSLWPDQDEAFQKITQRIRELIS